MVDSGTCLGEYREDELELHRETCIVRLMYRCSNCSMDFVSKEGLWNHLDLHEISDECKELHYQEIKAKHKFHQCVLCNDQRVYLEAAYWKHIEEVHDGFFLRCSECSKTFQSETLLKDHTKSPCKEKITWDIEDMEIGKVSNIEQLKTVNARVDTDNDADTSKNGTMSLPGIHEEGKGLPYSLPFPCPLCELKFSSYKRLRRHKFDIHGQNQKCPYCRRFFQLEKLKTHLPDCGKKKFTCEVCYLKFGSSRYLSKHMKTVHGMKLNLENVRSQDEAVVHCPHCNKKCADAQSLVEHTRKTHKPTQCSVCGITVVGAENARYHEIIKHTEPRYECTKCSKKYHWKKHLQNHLRVCDFVKTDQVSNNSSDPSTVPQCRIEPTLKDPEVAESNTSSRVSWIKCPHCEKKVVRAESLARHIKMYHGPVTCDLPGIDLPNLCQTQEHQNNHERGQNKPQPKFSEENTLNIEDETNVANVCSSAPNSQQRITVQGDTDNVHKLASNTSPDYSSEIRMDSEKLLQPFVVNQSNGQYWCTICQIAMSTYHKAKYHKLTKHTEEKYKCPYCPKKFHGNQSYRRHLPVCEARKHACDLCDQRFKTKQYLMNHKSQLHNIPGPYLSKEMATQPTEGKHKCHYCSKQFNVKQRYQRHVLVCAVRKYPCDLCDHKFKAKKYLISHKSRLHNIPGPYHNKEERKCLHCPLKFEKKQQYMSHLSKCREKEFNCDLCHRRFNTIGQVSQHKKLHHETEHVMKEDQQAMNNDDFQFSSEVICLRNGGEETTESSVYNMKDIQNNFITPADIELKMEIKVEDTILEEREFQASNEDQLHTTTPVKSCQLKDYTNSNNNATDVAITGIKIKQEIMEDETLILQQNTQEPLDRMVQSKTVSIVQGFVAIDNDKNKHHELIHSLNETKTRRSSRMRPKKE